ncbi:MAG: hypothetical protein FRX49_04359 [Trebouxia sp. A1-2]|nr:MAG: hypothetical protein FRX49_04359 [Trebouxia sp. A1-2]
MWQDTINPLRPQTLFCGASLWLKVRFPNLILSGFPAITPSNNKTTAAVFELQQQPCVDLIMFKPPGAAEAGVDVQAGAVKRMYAAAYFWAGTKEESLREPHRAWVKQADGDKLAVAREAEN